MISCVARLYEFRYGRGVKINIHSSFFFKTTGPLITYFLLCVPSALALSPQEVAARLHGGATTAVIFDVNGVLLKRSTKRSLKYIGLGAMARAIWNGNKFWDKQRMFKEMEQVPSTYEGVPLLHENLPMPGIMADWQLGRITGKDALALCKATLNPQVVLPGILDLMFNPEALTDVHDANPPAVRLLRELRRLNIGTYVISNMDLETADLLKRKFPEIFDEMRGVVWSAAVELVKPDPNIFHTALDQFELAAESAVFIDDEAANRQGSQQAGVDTMTEKEMKTLAKILERMPTLNEHGKR